MFKKILAVPLAVISISIHANNIVDIYGAQSEQSYNIINKYLPEIKSIQMLLVDESRQEFLAQHPSKTIPVLKEKQAQLKAQLKKEGQFLFVEFDTVQYDNEKLYTTVEVVEKNQPFRMNFIHKPVEHVFQKKHDSSDLIDAMLQYNHLMEEILLKQEVNFQNIECPVFHCFLGFNHPKLKPFLRAFNEGVIAHKSMVLKTLAQDEDPKRRAAAAFLIGHFKNPQEIVSVLAKHAQDPDEGVRNNAMRVIGETIKKAKIMDIDVMPFLALLSSPYDTDRNKALLILLHVSSSQKNRAIMIEHGEEKLLSLLKLKQPNNHKIAYLLLKNMSHKSYADNDITAWKNWFETHKNSIKKI